MSAEEFYKYIVADPKLEQALEDAIDKGALDAFLKEKGCTASADEVSKYIAEHS